MSELLLRRSQEEMLRRIEERLNQGITPAAVIEEMLPQTHGEALFWGRRLSVWDEYRSDYSAQVIALARLISGRAMRAFRLRMRHDGRVVEQPAEGRRRKTSTPKDTFLLAIGGEQVRVQYSEDYFPSFGTDLLDYSSPHDPDKPHALSETGYFSCFVLHDVVDACGGTQAYAALLADAVLRGQEQSFIEAFEGPLSVTDPRRHRPVNRAETPLAGHAERLLAEEENSQGRARQGMLF